VQKRKKLKSAVIVLTAILIFLLAGCDNIKIPWLDFDQSSPLTTPSEPSGLFTPEADITPTPTTVLPPTDLIIWLPPEMNIEGEQPAAALLKAKLEAFSKQHDEIEIIVRIKEVSGAGGLLDTLSATSAVAADTLPDLIALPRADLETASLKSLVFPVDGLTNIIDLPDWFNYAYDMALIQGSAYGIPFIGDSLVLVYRTDAVTAPLSNWDAILTSGLTIAFAGNDPQSNLTLALYMASGGPVQDNQRRPTLDVDILTEVLKLYSTGTVSGALSQLSIDLQTEEQAWKAYQQQQTSAAVISLTRYLQNLPENSSIILLPSLVETPATAASGWVWAVGTPKAERQTLAVQLAETLVEPDFLAAWSQALGRMPARTSSLDGWKDAAQKSLLSQISLSSILKPSNDIVNSLGPLLREATIQVMKGLVDPAQAAETAKEFLQ